MKPSKEQPTAKKPVNEKISNSGIKTFFKSTLKSFVVDQSVAPKAGSSTDANKVFYVDILKKRLADLHNEETAAASDGTAQTVDDAIEEEPIVTLPMDHATSSEVDKAKPQSECTGCIERDSEIDQWKEKYNQQKEDHKKLKNIYFKLTHNFADLHSKYTDLLKVATKPTVDESSDNAAAATSNDNVFTAAEVKFLQCMDLLKKHDCTFILHCLKYAYKEDLSILAHKTLFGTLEWTKIKDDGENEFHIAKAPLTPVKVKRIKGLFIERISKCGIDCSEYADRMKDPYVNKLIAAGIKNLSKKM